jgi:hypothetical protein
VRRASGVRFITVLPVMQLSLQCAHGIDLSIRCHYISGMKTELLQLRVQPSEKEGFQQAADLAGVALSAWVRERLRAAARRELMDAGEQAPFYRRPVEET